MGKTALLLHVHVAKDELRVFACHALRFADLNETQHLLVANRLLR